MTGLRDPRAIAARPRWRGLATARAALLIALASAACDAREIGDRPESTAFVPGRVEVGEQLGALRVEAMDVQPVSADSMEWTGRVRFTGTLALSGRYRAHPDAQPPILCFYPDSASALQLPRFANDQRSSWFCFSNQEEAEAELGGVTASGEATIVVNEFLYVYEPTDAYNVGHLQQVRQRR